MRRMRTCSCIRIAWQRNDTRLCHRNHVSRRKRTMCHAISNTSTFSYPLCRDFIIGIWLRAVRRLRFLFAAYDRRRSFYSLVVLPTMLREHDTFVNVLSVCPSIFSVHSLITQQRCHVCIECVSLHSASHTSYRLTASVSKCISV